MTEKISVWDILPDFDSFVSDMESNIRMDEETWIRYEDQPEDFLIDLLSDFGVGEWEDDQIESAVLNYLGKNQDVGPQDWPPPGKVEEKIILSAEDIGDKKSGDDLFCSAGAPGVGHVIYRITRIDDKWVYGYEIENTMRVLDPSEVI